MERRIKNHMQQNQTSSLDEMVKQLGNSIASLQAQNKTLGEKLEMSVTHANEVDNKIDSIEKSFQSLDNRIEQLKQDSAKKINDLAHAKPAEQEMNRSVDTQKLE
jgi:chaperonin cofactor prefoldin